MIRRIAPEALRGRVIADLDTHAWAAGHSFEAEPLAFEAVDGGRYLGGLVGRVSQRWMFIELLATAPDARGQGVGAQLLAAAEAEARAQGLVGLWLDTYSFQAPGFYIKLGFTEIGRIDDYPPGEARIFLCKRLAP